MPGLEPEFWVPTMMVEHLSVTGLQVNSGTSTGRTRLERRGSRWLFVKGRLAPERTVDEARAQVERLERVRTLLPVAGLDDEERLAFLASDEGLLEGRAVLRSKCVQCHDLRTILVRPRTPETWRRTVQRMAARSTVLDAIVSWTEGEFEFRPDVVTDEANGAGDLNSRLFSAV